MPKLTAQETKAAAEKALADESLPESVKAKYRRAIESAEMAILMEDVATRKSGETLN